MDRINKQPQGLPVLLMTEVWERFGFYVAQGLLILFLIEMLNYTDSRAYEVLGAFTALAYIMPVFGGYIADHVLGFRKTVIIGNILLALGYALLTLPQAETLYPALGMIVTGTGLFKPNISSLLGTFYEPKDPRREAGFIYFYMGINVGILSATAISGFVKQKFGWHASFGMASVGLIIGMITFIVGMRVLANRHLVSTHIAPSKLGKILQNKFFLTLVILLAIAMNSYFIHDYKLSQAIIFIGSAILFLVLFIQAFRLTDPGARYKLLALLILIISSIMFWALYFQMYFSLNLFIDRAVERYWFHINWPTVLFMSFEAMFLLLLGKFFANLWQKLAQKGRNPSIGFKFAVANLMIAVAFFLILKGIDVTGFTHLVNPMWIILAYFFVAIGELLLSPIGLSMVTILAPKNSVGMLMGVFFLALGLGAEFAGLIATEASVVHHAQTQLKTILTQYSDAFTNYLFYSLITVFVIAVLTPFLRNMQKGQKPHLHLKNHSAHK